MELKQTVLNTQDLNFWFLSDVGFYFGRLIKDLVTLVFLRTIGRWFVHGQLDIGFSTDNWTVGLFTDDWTIGLFTDNWTLGFSTDDWTLVSLRTIGPG